MPLEHVTSEWLGEQRASTACRIGRGPSFCITTAKTTYAACSPSPINGKAKEAPCTAAVYMAHCAEAATICKHTAHKTASRSRKPHLWDQGYGCSTAHACCVRGAYTLSCKRFGHWHNLYHLAATSARQHMLICCTCLTGCLRPHQQPTSEQLGSLRNAAVHLRTPREPIQEQVVLVCLSHLAAQPCMNGRRCS